MRKLRAAIVGAGLMGRWHAHYCVRTGGELTAIVDPRDAAACALQRRYPQARRFGALADCLSACAIDVVHVCTGTATHLPLAVLALDAAKPVLIEKPLAATAAETRQLLDLAGQHRVPLCTVHQFPHQEGFRHLHRGLSRLGKLVRIAFVACSAGGEGRSEAERRQIVLEILPHPVSLFYGLLGNALASCRWSVVRHTNDDFDACGTLADLTLHISISLRARPIRNELSVAGTEGTAYCNLFHGSSLFESGGSSRMSKLLAPFTWGGRLLVSSGVNLVRRIWRREWAYPGLQALIKGFYQSIGGNCGTPVDEEEIMLASRLMDEFRE